MKLGLGFKRWRLRAALGTAGLALLGLFLLWISGASGSGAAESGAKPPGPEGKAKAVNTALAAPAGEKVEPALPDEGRFKPAGESESLRLYVDPVTAHFKVESRASGRIWRSYPNPGHWEAETISGTWRNNLLSPVMAEYIDAGSSKSQSKLTNWMEEGSVGEGFEIFDGGFRITFRFARTGFTVPIEVRLHKDYVETKVLDEGIAEGALSLLNLKLYPMFGAEPSAGQEGYLFIPDGPGALVAFKEEPATQDKPVYKEPLYGPDAAFYNEPTGRNDVKMPVFGIKSGEQAFLAVIAGGEAYAKLFAAPAGSLGISNWATAEWQYRIKFFQATNGQGTEGFYTFSGERFIAPERSVRYYPLEAEASDYAGMAAKYRTYLMESYGLARIEPGNKEIPMFIDVIGADIREGFLWDDYIAGTTTGQAGAMITRLRSLGIANMTVHYGGWQRWGYSSYGGLFPVDGRIGGSSGMKAFIERAHELDVPVYLEANYSLNNSGRGGFWSRNDGLRNMAGTLQTVHNRTSGEDIPLVSPLYAEQEGIADMEDYRELGADGVLFTGGIGSGLSTDYNSRYRAQRDEVAASQQALIGKSRSELGGAAVADGSFYALKGGANHFHRLKDDYSYELFVDEAVPFSQIALHGVVTYSSDWINVDGGSREDFLRSIEYGAYPSFVFTAAESGDFKNAYTIWYYSMNAADWEEEAAALYRRYNEALGEVQNKFITGHRSLSPGVKETRYEGGYAVIVNYNPEPYQGDGFTVPGTDFIVKRGGEGG